MIYDKEFGLTRKEQDTSCECSTEHVLPDYNGDVRKILYSEANLRPGAKFMGEDEAEFSGQVAYKVIYSDIENKISGTEFYSDYDLGVKLRTRGPENVNCDTRVTNYAIRLLGPRKFSAKASVGAQVNTTEKAKLTSNMWEKAKDGEIQTKITNIKVRNTTTTESLEREIAESLGHLDGVTEDELKIIYFSAEPFAEQTSLADNNIIIKGKINLKCVIESEGNSAYTLKKAVPFEVEIPFGESDQDELIFPLVTVTSERFIINPDETGCEILANIIFEYSAVIEKNEAVSVVSDAFITSCPAENTYYDFNYTEICERVSHNTKNNSEAPRGELCEGAIREIIFINSFPKIESAKIVDNAVEVKGEIKYMGVTSEVNDDGSISYSGLRFTTPFAEKVNINCQTSDKTNLNVKILSEDANADLDAETVYFSSNLVLDVMILEEKTIKGVSECVGIEKDAYSEEKATVRVYYPDSDEDAFSVARKFRVSVGGLCEKNSISQEVSASDSGSLKLPKKLIIY